MSSYNGCKVSWVFFCMKDLYEFSKENNISQHLYSENNQKDFRKILKKGIYKELHKRNLLSDAQLNSLICEK